MHVPAESEGRGGGTSADRQWGSWLLLGASELQSRICLSQPPPCKSCIATRVDHEASPFDQARRLLSRVVDGRLEHAQRDMAFASIVSRIGPHRHPSPMWLMRLIEGTPEVVEQDCLVGARDKEALHCCTLRSLPPMLPYVATHLLVAAFLQTLRHSGGFPAQSSVAKAGYRLA